MSNYQLEGQGSLARNAYRAIVLYDAKGKRQQDEGWLKGVTKKPAGADFCSLGSPQATP